MNTRKTGADSLGIKLVKQRKTKEMEVLIAGVEQDLNHVYQVSI